MIVMIRPMIAKSTVFEYRCQTPIPRRARLCAALCVVLFLAASAGTAFGSDLFDKAAEAFLYNQPREAAPLLEQAIGEDPVNARAYLYLAISYEQLALYEQAITTLQRAETIPGIDRAAVYFNMGNNYVHLGNAALAEESYAKAIAANPLSTDAHLNRANLRVTEEKYPEAVEDYSAVLSLDPDHPQRAQIEQMIALLTDHIEQEQIRQAEAERQAAEAERQRVLAEEQQKAEEERQQQEAEARRRALLTNVLDSLKTATEDTTNMSAGNEDIDDYTDENIDIAD